ncbi:MAG: TetR/AcrR family transcriptional regulator [Alphaproteobacteria bacterium]|nr:TetR/AcrR family transcriptional regulator [Alphaproteobacteria bacterium]
MSKPPKLRLSRLDWLNIGLRELARQGSDGLQLEALCQAAGKTRGSFYHHFKDHHAFCEALMEHWKSRNTDEIIAYVEREAGSGGKREVLNALVARLDPTEEVAVRRFAAIEPVAKAAVEVVDRKRIDYLVQIVAEEFGVEPGNARLLAEFQYALFIGYQSLFPDVGEKKYRQVGRLVEAVVDVFAKPGSGGATSGDIKSGDIKSGGLGNVLGELIDDASGLKGR